MSSSPPQVHTRAPQGLPWLVQPFAQIAGSWTGHALLLYGPAGIGQFELALELAGAQLCETPLTQRELGWACGQCAACHMVAAKSHPDLLVLVPEAMSELWDVESSVEPEGAAAGSAGKAKPSLEIKVDAVRRVVHFAQQTASRGADKLVVIYPAESMNLIAANTLLKTLEEPAGRTRFILATGQEESLLPTVRSRCQAVRMPLPDPQAASAWLAAHGVEQPDVVLAAAGGQPQRALERAQAGWDARTWAAWPRALAAGQAGAVPNWPLPWLVEALSKLCHDAACVSLGGAPRYFPVHSVPQGLDLQLLTRWSQELQRQARQANHPLNQNLQAQALCQGARMVLSRAKFTITSPPAGLTSR